jgi:hypothetical protein
MTAVVAAAGLVLTVLSSSTPVPDSWGFPGVTSVFGLTFGSVGLVVARRLPGTVIGWLFLAIGGLFAVEGLIIAYSIAGVLAFPGRLPGARESTWVLTWIWVPAVLLAAGILPLVFPDGRLPSRRWRPALVVCLTSVVVSSVVLSLAPGPIEQATYVVNPLGIEAFNLATPAVGMLIFLPLIGSIALGAAALLSRFRQATGDARQQIKWLLLSCAGLGLGLSLTAVEFVLTGQQTKPFQIIILVGGLGIPVAAGLAILRYRLYEIDRIISRTLAYAVVTAVLAIVFVGVVLGLQAVLSAVTQANTLAVAGSTVIVAALFQPLRARVQRAADRRFNRSHYDAERTVAAFAERLRDVAEAVALRNELSAAVNRSVQPLRLGVWLRGDRGETMPPSDVPNQHASSGS